MKNLGDTSDCAKCYGESLHKALCVFLSLNLLRWYQVIAGSTSPVKFCLWLRLFNLTWFRDLLVDFDGICDFLYNTGVQSRIAGHQRLCVVKTTACMLRTYASQ